MDSSQVHEGKHHFSLSAQAEDSPADHHKQSQEEQTSLIGVNEMLIIIIVSQPHLNSTARQKTAPPFPTHH